MKTPIQELIDVLEHEIEGLSTPFVTGIVRTFIDDLEKLKEKEKQAIISAYNKGRSDYIDSNNLGAPYITAEQYYKDTYD